MDNCSIHLTINVKIKLKEFKWRVTKLPPYTPVYNFLELYFGIVKRRFWRKIESLVIKINDEHGVSNLKEAIVSISRDEIIRIFVKVLKTAKLNFFIFWNCKILMIKID